MLSYFQDKSGELPGGDQLGRPTDTSTWRNINKIAERVVDDCVIRRNMLGWEATGRAYFQIDVLSIYPISVRGAS